jgi:rubrerythrin
MSFADLKEIIDFAIQKEQEAIDFYEEISHTASIAAHKQMLRDFAGEEAKHKKMLEDFDPQAIRNYRLQWIKDIKRSNYLVTIDYEKGMAYRDILMLAMKREEKALALYNELQKEVADPDAVKLFKILCQEEAKHKLTLETLYDEFMAEMGD